RDFHVTGVQTCALPISTLVECWLTADCPIPRRLAILSSWLFISFKYKTSHCLEVALLSKTSNSANKGWKFLFKVSFFEAKNKVFFITIRSLLYVVSPLISRPER